MQLGRRQQVTTMGAVVVATALSLAACSSSSSSSLLTLGHSSSPPSTSGSGAATSSSASSSASTSTSTASGTIKAAGSTFQTNFQQGAISAFKSVDPNATVDYASVGSGSGRADLYANTVLFAGSDSPIPAKEASKVPAGKTVLYFPVQIGPIAMASH